MSNNQIIEYINISSPDTETPDRFNKYNNQIDTTGRINQKLIKKFNKEDIIKKDNIETILNDDKVYSAAKIDDIIEKNTYSYTVNNIIENEETATDDLIFVKETNYYTLKRKVINDNNESSYELYEVPLNSKVLIKDIQYIYILYNYIDINEGNETIKKQIWNNDIKTDELIVGKITPNYRPNTLQFTPIWYGITNIYTYFISNNNRDVYYIHNKSLGIEKIEIDYNDNDEKIFGAFIYENLLHIIISKNSNDTTTPPSKKILVYNTNFKIHTYDISQYYTIEIVSQEEKKVYHNFIIPYENPQYFINSIYMNNNNDVYLVLNDAIYLLMFNNNSLTDFMLINNFSSPITEKINIIHNLGQYLYILCNTIFYKYDINNDNIISFNYSNDINFELNYNYSITNNNMIYIKRYKNEDDNLIDDNNIYYLNETLTPAINKFVIPDHISEFDDNICKFNIVDNQIHLIKEIKQQIGPNQYIYIHLFYLYKLYQLNNQLHTELLYEYNLENYTKSIPYSSKIPIINSLGDFVFVETSYSPISPPQILPPFTYFYCRLIPPIMVISNNETYIKNVRISDDEIVLAGNSVIMPNDVVSGKLVTKNIIIKDNNIFITDKNKRPDSYIKHYYQTTKAIYYYMSDASSSNLYCYLLPSLDTKLNIKVLDDKDNDIMQSAFVYNDMIYILIYNHTIDNYYINIYDIEIKGNNSKIILYDTFNLTFDIPYTFNKYSYDENIIIDDILYLLNANTSGTGTEQNPYVKISNLYKCNLKTSSTLSFEYIKDLSILQTNEPSSYTPNTNYSNIKQIFNIHNILYIVYYENYLDDNDNTIKPEYKLYVYDLDDETIGYNGYNIDIRREEKTINSSNEEIITYYKINLLNYCMMNNETLYFNIIDQNGNLRGIFYINDFSNPGLNNYRILKLYPLFQDNAYSFNIINDMFYVITTQKYKENTTPQIYTYYLNYYNQTENILQSTKIVEKKGYSKFGLLVPPLIADNVLIILLDSNKVYDMYTASLFSHMFSQDRSIINNNVVITPNFAQLLNNLYITSSKCTINTDPINKNDITHKKYVDDNITSKISNIHNLSLEINNENIINELF